MERGRESRTATLCALLRAAHLVLDSKPHILCDELAAQLAGFSDPAALHAALDSFEEELTQRSSAMFARAWIEISRITLAARARYTEDLLDRAVERGVSQYVVLGAGFDSFAYRRPDLAKRVRIFEVDHPDTQEKKRVRLAQMQVPAAPNVTYVAVDFEKQQSIIASLEANGYRHEVPALFSWLGVIWYLSDAAIERRCREMASAAPGSAVVLDYLVPQSMLDERTQQIVRMAESLAAARGEYGGRCFEPAQMAELLTAAGFDSVEDCGSRELNARYLAARSDGLQIPEMMHMVAGHVKSSAAESRPRRRG